MPILISDSRRQSSSTAAAIADAPSWSSSSACMSHAASQHRLTVKGRC